jgi:sugar phosphate permease
MKMNGIGHKAGWEWIFILEGVFTLLFGITSYLLLPRSPEHAGFLSNREKAYIATQLKQDGTTSKDEYADTFSWREVGKAFTLPHVWMLSIVFFFTGQYSIGGSPRCFHLVTAPIFCPFLGTTLYALA